jgi:hypothetical protein
LGITTVVSLIAILLPGSNIVPALTGTTMLVTPPAASTGSTSSYRVGSQNRKRPPSAFGFGNGTVDSDKAFIVTGDTVKQTNVGLTSTELVSAANIGATFLGFDLRKVTNSTKTALRFREGCKWHIWKF